MKKDLMFLTKTIAKSILFQGSDSFDDSDEEYDEDEGGDENEEEDNEENEENEDMEMHCGMNNDESNHSLDEHISSIPFRNAPTKSEVKAKISEADFKISHINSVIKSKSQFLSSPSNAKREAMIRDIRGLTQELKKWQEAKKQWERMLPNAK